MTTTAPAPVPIIRGTQTVEEKKGLDYSRGVLPFIPRGGRRLRDGGHALPQTASGRPRSSSSCTASCGACTGSASRTCR